MTTYTALFTELVSAEIELWDSLDAHLRASSGITLPNFQALAAVDKLDSPVRVQDISVEMSITVGATSKLVDRLERDGRVTRNPNPDDRRSSVIVLTANGAQALAAGAEAAEVHLAALLAKSFSESRATALAAELAAVRQAVSA